MDSAPRGLFAPTPDSPLTPCVGGGMITGGGKPAPCAPTLPACEVPDGFLTSVYTRRPQSTDFALTRSLPERPLDPRLVPRPTLLQRTRCGFH